MDVECVNSNGKGTACKTCGLASKQSCQVGEFGMDMTNVVFTTKVDQFIKKMSMLENG